MDLSSHPECGKESLKASSAGFAVGDPQRPSLRYCLAMTGLACCLSIALAESYSFVQAFGSQAPHFAAAWVHSLLALFVLILFLRRSPTIFRHDPLPRLQRQPWLAFLPAVVVITAALLLIAADGGFTSAWTQSTTQSFMPQLWVYVLWIPVVEELALRVGLGSVLKRVAGRWWGAYFSVLAFTVLHSQPTLERVLSGQLAFLWGPFLLAVCCELLYTWSNRVLPAILLHMACNSTAFLFTLGGQRWLRILAFLYQPSSV